jgi:hypothetical protein
MQSVDARPSEPRPERRLLTGLRPHRHHRLMTQEEHRMDLPGSCPGAPDPAGLPRPPGAGAGAAALGRARPAGRAR